MSIFAVGRSAGARAAAVILGIILPASSGASRTHQAAPADSVAGEYIHSQMELIAGIRLNPNGTFEYGLTVGSLDERAQGRWKRVGERIELTSDPRPVAPVITAGPIELAPGKPFAIRLLAPNGQDVPGVDLRVEFASGEALDSYVAGGLWSLPPDELRQPRFITFSKDAYRLRSERLPLRAEAGTVATFILTPNDLGTVDLTGTYAELEGDSLTLYRPEGSIRFERMKN